MPTGTILVVDDDRLCRESLAELLDDRGWATTQMPGGIPAWDHLRQGGKQSTSLVVSDVDMPDISGFELLSRAREIQFTAPFLFVSARADEHLRELAHANGAAGLLPKPVTPNAFTDLVASLLDGQSGPEP